MASHFYQQIKSEYETIRVVQMVDDYVGTHDGDWPSSWEDLDGTDAAKRNAPRGSSYFRRYTTVDFTLTTEQLIGNPELIYDAVTPLTHKYMVYSHARRDLNGVMQTIRQARARRRRTLDAKSRSGRWPGWCGKPGEGKLVGWDRVSLVYGPTFGRNGHRRPCRKTRRPDSPS